MKQPSTLNPISTLILLLATGAVATAKKPEPLFPERLLSTELDQYVELKGQYRYIYKMFFKVYDIALYAPPETNAETIAKAETEFQLNFRYLRKIDKSIILESSEKTLKRNVSAQQLASIRERVDKINAAYTGVRKGDTSSLSFTPQTGTTLRINGSEIITIPGEDFAQLYFKIWLGERSLSKTLTANLLGLK